LQPVFSSISKQKEYKVTEESTIPKLSKEEEWKIRLELFDKKIDTITDIEKVLGTKKNPKRATKDLFAHPDKIGLAALPNKRALIKYLEHMKDSPEVKVTSLARQKYMYSTQREKNIISPRSSHTKDYWSYASDTRYKGLGKGSIVSKVRKALSGGEKYKGTKYKSLLSDFVDMAVGSRKSEYAYGYFEKDHFHQSTKRKTKEKYAPKTGLNWKKSDFLKKVPKQIDVDEKSSDEELNKAIKRNKERKKIIKENKIFKKRFNDLINEVDKGAKEIMQDPLAAAPKVSIPVIKTEEDIEDTDKRLKKAVAEMNLEKIRSINV